MRRAENFLTVLPKAPSNKSEWFMLYFFFVWLVFLLLLFFALLWSVSMIFIMFLLIFWRSTVAAVSTLRSPSAPGWVFGTISVLSVVTKAAAQEDLSKTATEEEDEEEPLSSFVWELWGWWFALFWFGSDLELVGNHGAEWHAANDLRANWLLQSDWSTVESRLVLVCQARRKQQLSCDTLLPPRFKPSRRKHFALGTTSLHPRAALSTSVWNSGNSLKSRNPHDAKFPRG